MKQIESEGESEVELGVQCRHKGIAGKYCVCESLHRVLVLLRVLPEM